MTITPTQLGEARRVQEKTTDLVSKVAAQDNQPGVDLDPAADSVVISGKSLKSPLVFPADNPYKHEVVEAEVKGGRGKVSVSHYYDSSYGRSAADLLHYSVEQDRRGQVVYTEQRDDVFNTNNRLTRVTVDPTTNQVVGFKQKEWAMTYGEALKEVATTPAGLFLVAVGAALGGVPGSLGYVLMGPAGALVTGGAVALGLAYAKTRPW